jgi:hypothetical protein
MDRVDWFNYRRSLDSRRTRQQTRQVRPRGMDPAHVMAAEAGEGVGLALTPRQLDTAGLAIHYGLGIVPGALYGALRGRVDYLDAGRGSVFGLGLFLIQDEGINAAVGLSGRPQDYPGPPTPAASLLTWPMVSSSTLSAEPSVDRKACFLCRHSGPKDHVDAIRGQAILRPLQR